MPIVEVPEIKLLKSGIPQRYVPFSLAKLKSYAEHQEAYKTCCRYTRSLSSALSKGVGLCLYGDQTTFRQYAFYGVLKAAIAQGKSVQVADVEDILQSHSDHSDLHAQCVRVDILGIPEMDLPESVVTNYTKAIIFKLFKKRAEQGRPIVMGTSLQVVHPDHSLDMLYPGVGQFIVNDTVLVNMRPEDTCQWIRKGHRAKLSSLATLKVKI